MDLRAHLILQEMLDTIGHTNNFYITITTIINNRETLRVKEVTILNSTALEIFGRSTEKLLDSLSR